MIVIYLTIGIIILPIITYPIVDLMSKGYLGNSYLLHSKSNPIIGQQCEFCKNIKYNVKN